MRAVAARDRLPEAYRWLARTATLRAARATSWPSRAVPTAASTTSSPPARSACPAAPSSSSARTTGTRWARATPPASTPSSTAASSAPSTCRTCRATELPVEALERAAMGGLLATNRWLQPEMIGALGLLELQAGPRCRLVLQGFDRLGVAAGRLPLLRRARRGRPGPRQGLDGQGDRAAGRRAPRVGRRAWSRAPGGGRRSTCSSSPPRWTRSSRSTRRPDRRGGRALSGALASGSVTTSDEPHQVTSEVGRLRTVLLHRPGAGAVAAHAAQQRRPALRRPAVGRPGAGGARRLRRGAARARRRGALPDRPARRGARRRRRPATPSSTRPSRRRVVGPLLADVLRKWLGDLPSARAGAGAVGRAHPRRAARARRRRRRRPAGRLRRVRRPPAAEPAVHPRLVGVGRRPRRRHQPVDAGPGAGAVLHRRDLRAPPPLRRHPAALRRRARRGVVRGRRRARDGARASSPSAPASARRRPASRPSRCGPSPRGSRTPCWPSRSRRSGRRCTSTPSARWSTATPS